MDMLTGEQIAEAELDDWRKLAQGRHARCVVAAFGPVWATASKS
jgi:4a-hydroxytetrahydrobiopterin dehydratase